MSKADGNVAFKCTYNDGGEPGFVGFDGTCSKENIRRNVEAERVWCSAAGNACRQFYDDGMHGRRPGRPCYESRIFRSWSFGPGTYHPGTGKEKPVAVKYARKGKVALLTTRHPEHNSEDRRLVFGAYRIERIRKKKNGEVFLQGDPDHALRLSEEAAVSLPFWEFNRLPKSRVPDWRSGLVRYVSDRDVTNFLHALEPYLKKARDRKALASLLECCGNLKPDGGRLDPNRKAWGGARKGKYGSRGESKRHLRLKRYIARHPRCLELGPGRGWQEHSFVTGDRVDVLVELNDGRECVVEVELEGQPTLVGAHQALKYRALRAGQSDTTELPFAILAAYSIPQNVVDFCRRHDVIPMQIRPR